jgi:hypothetical protein
MNTPAATEWIERCVVLLLARDPHMTREEARVLAQDMLGFQRTAAMTPEAAVDFVAAEMLREQPRLERRFKPRE